MKLKSQVPDISDFKSKELTRKHQQKKGLVLCLCSCGRAQHSLCTAVWGKNGTPSLISHTLFGKKTQARGSLGRSKRLTLMPLTQSSFIFVQKKKTAAFLVVYCKNVKIICVSLVHIHAEANHNFVCGMKGRARALWHKTKCFFLRH